MRGQGCFTVNEAAGDDVVACGGGGGFGGDGSGGGSGGGGFDGDGSRGGGLFRGVDDFGGWRDLSGGCLGLVKLSTFCRDSGSGGRLGGVLDNAARH